MEVNEQAPVVIKPTPGRQVWYHPSGVDKGIDPEDGQHRISMASMATLDQPLAATVVGVHSDRMVNLAIFDANGILFTRRSVVLLQDGDVVPEHGAYAEWMPYQIKQAAKQTAA